MATTSSDLERSAQVWVAHAAAGDVFHFNGLQMVARLREKVVISGMVIVQMANDHAFDLIGPNIDRLETLGDRIEHFTLRFFAIASSKPGIDD